MKRESLQTTVLSLACLVSFGLCGQPVAKTADHPYPGGRSRIFEMETKLDTDSPFHALHSDYEGYLISIEKVARANSALKKKIAPSYQSAVWQNKPVFNFQALSNSFEPKQARGEVADIMKLLFDEKVQLITQVTYRSTHPDRGHLVTVLWDLYSNADAPVDHLDRAEGPYWHTLPKQQKRVIVRERNQYLINRSAAVLLETLASDLKKRITNAPSTARYTHIIVVSTGWNTPLWESEVNYADWQKVIGREMRLLHPATPFRPLFIGLTWPSFWKSRWNWAGSRSFLNKAHDADEIGLTWANLLVNKVLPDVVADLDQKPRLIAIGHSFGARLLSRAVNSGTAANQPASGAARFSLFIGLQSAFTVNRFMDKGGEGSPYRRTFTNRVARYAFVSSTNDNAIRMAPGTLSRRLRLKSGGTNLGDPSVAKYIKGKPNASAFTESIKVGADGSYEAPKKRDAPIWLLDGSEVVRQNVYSTGGGAHSDVFNKGAGCLIAHLIKQADDANLK